MEGTLDHRLPPVVETAAYFVVAEALTNVAKHARGAAARVTLSRDGAMLVVEVADNGPGGADPSGERADRAAPARRGARRPARGPQRCQRGDGRLGRAAVRVVVVEDQALLREGIVALLAENGIEVVAQADDGPGLLRIVDGHKPDLAICDVRLPPTLHRRGHPGRARGPPAPPRARRPGPVAVRRAGLHRRAARVGRERGRLPAQGACQRGEDVRRLGQAGRRRRHRARSRGRQRADRRPRPFRRRRRARRADRRASARRSS